MKTGGTSAVTTLLFFDNVGTFGSTGIRPGEAAGSRFRLDAVAPTPCRLLLSTDQQRFQSGGPFAAKPAIVEGTSLKVRLAGVDWSRNGQTLVLAISTHGHFCTESTPFFRQIAKEKREDIKLSAVLPESVAEGEQYLSREAVHVDRVSPLSLASAGIPGTPTMLLVDSSGVVTHFWAGKLDPPVQEQVLSLLREEASPKPPTAPNRDRSGG